MEFPTLFGADRPQTSEPRPFFPTAVLVTGMGRSGTSALTRVLMLSGGRLPDDLTPATAYNPRGYWEPQRVLQLNEALLAEVGVQWNNTLLEGVFTSIRPERWQQFRTDVQQFLGGLGVASEPLILKEPRISGIAERWIEAIQENGWAVKIVHAFRHPEEVAGSLSRRYQMERPQALALWMKYNLLPERATRDLPRAFVSYDLLLRDWRAVLKTVAETLELPLSAGSEVEDKVRAFLTTELRHHNQADAPREASEPNDLVRRLYESLLQASQGFNRSSEFDSLYAEAIRQQAEIPLTRY